MKHYDNGCLKDGIIIPSIFHRILYYISLVQFHTSKALRAKPSLMTVCPHCGAELKKGATFCPHCGSDKNTGWKEGAEYSDLDLPDYDEILENEFGDNPNSPYAKKKNANPFGIIVVTIVVIAFIAAMIL